MNFRNIVAVMGIQVLVFVPLFFGMFCLFLEVVFFKKYSGSPIENILICLAFFFWGCSGIPMIIRKEALHGSRIVTGTEAVINGVIAVLLNWGIMVGFLVAWLW